MSSSTVFGTITLPASVFDNAGVKKVQFFIDGKLIGTDKTASSQSVSLPTFSAAQLAVYDGTNSSLPIYIGLNGLVYDVTAGSRFYAPRGPYYFLAGLDSSVQLNQIGGSIITSKYPVVGYLAMGGGQVINASRVFSVSWNTSCFANGRHPVTVKAFDIEGNSSISSVISVIVNNAPKKHHKDDDLDREDREKESSVHKDDSEHSPSGAQGNQRNWQGRGNGNAFGIQFQQSGNKQLSKEVKKNVRSED
jgi:predicted heme/steroid binding protein